MGYANFAGWNFRIDPNAVHWDFKVRTNTKYTLGGKVVQVLGTEFGNIKVKGEFGRGHYPEQRSFLEHMIEVGNSQVSDFASSEPPRFIYPTYGWDFMCYLVSYTSDQGKAVVFDSKTISPVWQLELHIVEDNSGLSEATTENFIKRLAEGIGWEINEHNGPAEWETVRDFLNKVGANDLPELYQMAYGSGNAEGSSGGSGNGAQQYVEGTMTANEVAYVAQDAGFRGDSLLTAVAVAIGESTMNPNAEGDTTITDDEWGPSIGLWQIRSLKAESGTGGTRDASRLKDPFFNANSAWVESGQGTNFQPWTVYNEGIYQQHLDQAREGINDPQEPDTSGSRTGGGPDSDTGGAAYA